MSGHRKRWNIRNVSKETIAKVREVAECSGYSFGELIDQAVEVWYEALPVEEPLARFRTG
ncbi:MAG: hypothetical protein KDB07_10770 [Planctomycetes bacterium]|nr:hypothetical protein [Planctomycetota bacterium]